MRLGFAPLKEKLNIEFPQYLSINSDRNAKYRFDNIVEVVGYLRNADKKMYTDGKGYVNPLTNTIWIYKKEKPLYEKNRFPNFWITKGKIHYSNPSIEALNRFKIKNCSVLDLETIITESKDDDVMYNEQAINDMNNASSNYKPTIKDNDDYLKKIVKTILLDKNLEFSRMKCKLEHSYSLSNMKQALEKDTKMGVLYFAKWCEILNVDFSIIIKDNGIDKINPLPKTIIYESCKDRISYLK